MLKRNAMYSGLDCQLKKIQYDEETPLSFETQSGMIIKKIEEVCEGISTYKTNLVKCLPLTPDLKLRYPNKHEITCCVENLVSEIELLNPRIVFLLGEKVYSSVEKHLHISFEKWHGFNYNYKEYNQMYFIPVHHPSYIYVYKRKYIDEYVLGIKKIISELL